MKLCVIGATGRTGGEVIQQALARGHMVTAFVRLPEGIHLKNERLKIVKGEVTDEEELLRAMQNHDAVVCLLGSAKGLQGLNSSRQRPCDHARNAPRWNKTARCSLGGGTFSRYSKPDRELYHARSHARFAGNGRNRPKQRPRENQNIKQPAELQL
jgi:putative NADH-flavin reductase